MQFNFAGTSVELFAGAGGLGLGLADAGFKPRSVIEFNRWCCDTLRANREALSSKGGEWKVVEADVRFVDFREHDGKVDIISGGPPCQPFSLGGRHKAYDDLRDMFPQAVRAVREARPKAFIFENVKGLTRTSFKNYFQYISLQLEHPEVQSNPDEDWLSHLSRLEQHHTSSVRTGLNYRVITRLLNAADYGVPQRRDRVVFVGFRDDTDVRWSFPDADHTQEALVWSQLFGDYWDENEVPRSERRLEGRSLQIAKKTSRDEKPTQNAWKTVRAALTGLSDPEIYGNKELNHVFQAGARSYAGHTGSYLDEPAKALKAGVHGVPGGENMLRRANGSVRYFTVRESARLQTFPDKYRFHGAWSECMRQLGNAVPVELARRVGKSVADQLIAIT